MPQTESWTLGRLINWTTEYLEQHGAQTPRLDAEILLAEARSCQRIQLYTDFAETADEQTRLAFRELVRRRAEGMPVAYLVGHKEFYSLSFRVMPDVLIPRPETEHLVVVLMDLVKEYSSTNGPLEIADVGTGSGILAVCSARHVKHSRVTAVDLSGRALEVARRNVQDHQVTEQVTLVQSDLFDSVEEAERFDFILSNPPYVSRQEFEALEPSVREFEPREALLAGERGTEIYERLIPQAAERLKPGGWLILEISPMINEAVVNLLKKSGRFGAAMVTKDLAGLPRVVHAQRRGVNAQS